MLKVIRATDLQNQIGSTGKKKDKLFIISIIVLVSFVFYLLILFKMQVVEGAGYRMESTLVAQRTKTLPAQRGEIYDRKADLPIVNNIDSFAVDIVPGETGNKYDSVTARLAQYLGMSKTEIDKKIPVSMRSTYTAYQIKSNVSFEEINNIAENITDLPGVSWRSKPLRYYTETKSLSHVIGYVGDIGPEELKVLYNKGYTGTSIIGKAGIESQYDELLQGTSGIEYRTVDVKGRNLSNAPVTKTPEMGKNLVLTIDLTTQHLVEDALGERIGAAVVLKPSTGEVLAMASYPYYDANLYSSRPDAAELKKLESNPNSPFLNRAVNAAYPPASTFKVIMTTALLCEKTFPADQTIECTGIMNYGGRSWKCHIYEKGTHGALDLKNALAQSCNIYFWTIGRDYLGVDRISSYANDFGYGLPLGIDLPVSNDGFVPTSQWKERRYHQKWMDGDTMNMSIGQSDTLVTPLHVADMMSMIVNEGVIYKPHLLKEIRDPATNEIIESIEPEPMYTMDLDTSIWKEVKTDLRYMITDGSAQYPLTNKIVQIAGKTGTAEVSGYTDSWHSWFVGYGPYDGEPEDAVVVVVLVEAANKWEWWAPYASNIIFQGIFANQTYDEAVKALHFTNIAKPTGRQE
ncbi:MAG: penicillin-binding protein 2 [Treponemataceae bacterium]|nr:penicillin-binding protein 2 [Treponemataceae bacterium]